MLNARFLYSGISDSFSGYSCADDKYRSEHLLYAYYGRGTTLHDIINQLVEDSWNGSAGETIPDDVTDDDVRAALLAMLSSTGRGDYDNGAVAECAIDIDVPTECPDCKANIDDDEYDICPACGIHIDCDESPIFVVVLEYVKPEVHNKRTEGSVLVGRKDGEYYFIESVFEHADDFRGCTGMGVYPLTEAMGAELLSIDNLEERYYDCWIEKYLYYTTEGCEDCRCGLDKDGCEDCGYPSLKSWCQEIVDADGIDAVIDSSPDKVEALNTVCDDYIEYADCCSCGRIFSQDDFSDFDYFDEIYNRKALVACLAYEDGAASYDYATKIIFGRTDS